MKIVSIKKRPWWSVLVGINEWRVGVEKDGVVTYYNCWAGIGDPTISNLLWDLQRKLHNDMDSLIGREI